MENVHEIRFCRISEFDLLVKFINNHWKQNHILAVDRQLLNWQHLDVLNDRYNFVVAYNKNDFCFDGILGFIPTCQYDKSLAKEKDTWLAIWKVIQNKNNTSGLGISLLEYLIKENNPRSIMSIGINDKVSILYKKLGFNVGYLNHYFLRNPGVSRYNIMFPGQCANREKALSNKKYKLSQIESLDFIDDKLFDYYPRKSKKYFINRYSKHPIYRYYYYGLFADRKLKACFVIRPIKVNDSCCLRVVDFCGNIFKVGSLKKDLINVLRIYDAEYIDFLAHGLGEAEIISMGFEKTDESIIIPNYFEPFEKKRTNIMFAYKCSKKPFCIFKGDSDQDRPNTIKSGI